MNALEQTYQFRTLHPWEGDIIATLEEACFPPQEVCPRESILQRAQMVPDLFLVCQERETGKVVAFLSGMATEEESFRDAFFLDASTHDPQGPHIMLVGLGVLPAYQGQGLGKELLRRYTETAKKEGRKALYLTCHPEMMKFYHALGFEEIGTAASQWSGDAWREMKCSL